MMRNLILLLVLFLGTSSGHASHIRGGEIRYTHLSGLTYRIELHHYTRLDQPTDHPNMIVFINGNATDTLERDSYVDIVEAHHCGGGVRINHFIVDHTFSGVGGFVITFEDQNRNGGIINVPNSIAQSFCVSATLFILPGFGHNNSVIFENPQYIIDPYHMIEPGHWFLGHSLSAFDADGDSLSFEAVTPAGIGCQPITGYQFPMPSFNVDPGTGDWEFNASTLGEYVIAIMATEWREGQMIGQVIRDMSICVLPMTSVNDLESAPSFTISPTLTEGPIRITSTLNNNTPLRVYSASGALVMEAVLRPGEQWLDLSALCEGLYVARVDDHLGRSTSARIIKQ